MEIMWKQAIVRHNSIETGVDTNQYMLYIHVLSIMFYQLCHMLISSTEAECMSIFGAGLFTGVNIRVSSYLEPLQIHDRLLKWT